MKQRVMLLTMVAMFLATPELCFAEMGIELVSKERAKELGIEIRLKDSGPDAAWVEMEFKAVGPLKELQHVSLEIQEGDKFLLGYARLEHQVRDSDRIHVIFLVNRGLLDNVTLRVVTGRSRDLTGHDLRLRDLLDLKKP